MLAMIERRERYLHMGCWRRHYADEVHVVARDQLAPIVGHVTDFEFIGSALGIFTMGARNRHNARANAVFESRNLCRASKARADNSNANNFVPNEFIPNEFIFCQTARSAKVKSKSIVLQSNSQRLAPPGGLEPRNDIL